MEGSWCKLAIVAIALIAGAEAKSSLTQSLDGTWVGRETEYYYEYPGTVPGGVYTDMMDLNLVDDIFYGFGDNSTKWIGQINWTYALNFTIDPELLEYDNVNLVFEGVDTFTDIILNNVTVGSTTNMFVRYSFDVKDLLVAQGNNTVRVNFNNAPEVGLKRNNIQLRKYKIPWQCPPDSYHGECHINMIRKMQASFAWDWGPSFPSMGLWKPVYLEGFDDAVIRYIVPNVESSADGDSWLVTVDTYFEPNSKGTLSGALAVKLFVEDNESIEVIDDVDEKVNEKGELVKSIIVEVDKSKVKLWWPNGYGDQPLYELLVTFSTNDGSIVTKKVNTGIRTVELVEEALETGATFYFKVNGEPIFAKGSNEIPISVLPEKGQDRQTIRYLLQSAKDVNMNMLRVWGGGVYESDYFYEIADELGIMIWQDFMFACSLYPATEEFLTDVIAEVNHNIKRIYYHPSIVVYSGNNENEGVLADNWYDTADNYDVYKEDYVALYIDTIRTEFERIAGGKGIFIASSPSNANLTESEGWVGQSPGNQFWGDVHFYNYALNPWDSNSYPVPRFCSEYGYQSLPAYDSWMTATNDTADLEISSVFMDWRQHHSLGNAEMALLIGENIEMPSSKSEHYTEAFIYLSQVYQAQAIKVETEHYRRYRSYLNDDGKGYTMGALYWQLNDVWVAPTWSSIDFTGRWKMLHYFAKDFFANVIVTGHINADGNLQIYTVNDNLSEIEKVTVVTKLFKYDSADFEPVFTNSADIDLKAGSSQLIDVIQTEDFLSDNNCEKTTCFFHFVVQVDDVAISPENYVFPGKLKASELASPVVKIESVKQAGVKTFEVTVSGDNIALFVWLDSHSIKGTFSENGFLLAEASRTVSFHYGGSEVLTPEELEEALTVTHLKDAYWS